MTWKSALLALLLFSGSLYAQGQPNHQPGFEQIKEGDNPVYISTIGVTEIPEKPDVVTYPLISNITADIPGFSLAKGSSVVVTMEMNCRTGQGQTYGMKMYSEHFGRGRLTHDFTGLQWERDASLPNLHSQPAITTYLLAAVVACSTVGKPLGGTPDVLQNIQDIIEREQAANRVRHRQ